ncbi:pyridoxal phosphate-dependent aminotransferase family protein [Pyxidicoccus fallax]|uniref:Pyridoxal phosphate-dependent aminotransferase family protein n=1 Tax=Pyxidicoccus fallax TaxID=394095 RepID=A0A848LC69_9BACT|nr:pyridoxal phosphate-dependent aminotransferase family protein [Pyxidicoccus fallax]NMO16539.1 pyridoxal phosphate-dependent aminotransferase family protein [Pyxidicoccus fallax]NPC78140.1 pyridoxal phosphate-dependent aminotransferase family protein [Pyxidicoccus fallax]
MTPLDRDPPDRSRSPIIRRLLDDPRVAQARLGRRIGRLPYFTRVESATGPITHMEGREILNFGSNNYLGLANDPRVISAAQEATARWGAGVTGSRLLNGNLALHEELEEALRRFYGRTGAMVFPTGYAANLGLMSSLLGRHDRAYVDDEMHASVLDGIALARAHMKRFGHNDPEDLRAQAAGDTHAGICVVEGVYSMRGDRAPLRNFLDVCRSTKLALVVDEAHGLGTAGERGLGTVEDEGIVQDADFITITFSKSLGSCGGAIIADAEQIEALRINTRPFLFTAANTPASVAAALASLRILQAEPHLVRELKARVQSLRDALARHGIQPIPSDGPIVSVEVGADFDTLQAWRLLWNRGIYTNPVISPAVPPGRGLLRMSVMRTHEEQMVRTIADACADVFTDLQLSQEGRGKVAS